MENQNFYQPQPQDVAKKNKKTLIIAIVCVLIAAIVAGVLLWAFVFKDKDSGDKASGKKANQEASIDGKGSEAKSPQMKMIDSFDKTLFNSQKLDMKVKFNDGSADSEFRLKMKLGNDVASSDIEFSSADGTYHIHDGKIDISQGGMTNSADLKMLFNEINSSYSEQFGQDFDIEKVLNDVINNKIDKDAIANLVNSYAGTAESALGDQGLDIDIPDIDKISSIIEDYLENHLPESAFVIKEVSGGYEFTVNAYELVSSFKEFIKNNKDVQDIINEVNEQQSIDVMDEAEEGLDDIKEMNPVISGKIIMDNAGRLSSFEMKCDTSDGVVFSLSMDVSAE